MCDTGVVYKGPLTGPGAPKDAYTKSIADRCVWDGCYSSAFNSTVMLALPLSVRVCRAQSPMQPQAHADYSSREAPPSWYQIGKE